MLFSRDGHNIFLGDLYRGRSAFLLCSGPSLTTHDLSLLQRPGVLTMAVNNAAVVHRPQLWCSVDDPGNFCDMIWRDPAILKFAPLCHMEKPFTVRDSAKRLVDSQELVGDMPAVLGFRRNETFVAERWLREDTFNWGNHSDKIDEFGNKGSRSVMYVALRLLHYLGIRTVYLLGCDFRMEVGRPNYAFEQDRSRSSVRGNNSSYRILNVRLEALKPYFEKDGFRVLNCTPHSGLTAFPHIDFAEAVEQSRAEMPGAALTAGMYDRRSRQSDVVKRERDGTGVVDVASSAPPSLSIARSPSPPDHTLVIVVKAGQERILEVTWATWARHKPDLVRRPLLVIHDPQSTSTDLLSEWLKPHPRARLMATCVASATGRERSFDESFDVARCLESGVETPWYLLLDPTAVATGRPDWIDAEWFSADQQGRTPALVGSRWGYLKPADILKRLDEWGDRVEGLRECPRLSEATDPDADRVRIATIGSWCLFGETSWTRRMIALLDDACPTRDLRTFLFYAALRQGRAVVRAPLKDLGWEHSHGRGLGQIRASLRRSLSEDAMPMTAFAQGERE